MSATTASAPRRASSSQSARPMPEAPPVTMATRLWKEFVIPGLYAGRCRDESRHGTHECVRHVTIAHMEPAPVQVKYCSECGQPWPQEELARFGDRLICSNCKIAYAQKLREGVASAATFTYAGFWIRLVAMLLDGVILFVVSVVVQLAFAPMLRSGRM